MIIQSPKVFDGYSTVFRQWRAEGTHCRFLHGYGVSFKAWFEGDMDEKNWVMDFGRAKRSDTLIYDKTLKEYLDWLLDHTVVVAQDDPAIEALQVLDNHGVIQLRVLEHVGAEQFAAFLLNVLNDWALRDSQGRVYVRKIEFFEHNKNSATVQYSNEEITQARAPYISQPASKEAATDSPLSLEDAIFKSLYEYLGYPAGADVGKAVAEAAKERGLKENSQAITSKNYTGRVAIYPVSFLNEYFKK